MDEFLTFEQAFVKVMDKEFGCTVGRSKAILQFVNDELLHFNKLENRLLRGITKVLEEGNIFNEMGGLGNTDFAIYFKNQMQQRGVVPSRFFKQSKLSDEKVKRLLSNWENLMFDQCPKCNNKSAVMEVEHQRKDKNKIYRDVYELSYCERCSRIFVRDMRKV